MSHSVKCVWLTASYLEANACKRVRFGAPANLPVSMLRSSLGEVVNCAPITGRDEECRGFPWAAA
jgi:hypothetical protein